MKQNSWKNQCEETCKLMLAVLNTNPCTKLKFLKNRSYTGILLTYGIIVVAPFWRHCNSDKLFTIIKQTTDKSIGHKYRSIVDGLKSLSSTKQLFMTL